MVLIKDQGKIAKLSPLPTQYKWGPRSSGNATHMDMTSIVWIADCENLLECCIFRQISTTLVTKHISIYKKKNMNKVRNLIFSHLSLTEMPQERALPLLYVLKLTRTYPALQRQSPQFDNDPTITRDGFYYNEIEFMKSC